MERFCASIDVKRTYLYVSAKNKTVARKKINKKLQEQKGSNFVKIDYIEESIY